MDSNASRQGEKSFHVTDQIQSKAEGASNLGGKEKRKSKKKEKESIKQFKREV